MQITRQDKLILSGAGDVPIVALVTGKRVIYLKLPLGVDRIIQFGGHLITFGTGIPIAQGKGPSLAMNCTVEILGIPMPGMEIIFIVIVKVSQSVGLKSSEWNLRDSNPSVAGCSLKPIIGQ